ncbi:unnamed protein product [Durusdinium trenchii]|uniref:Uncharacterized protein n=1 Tax=Durusdinium trenchii TaxID=1381693 RepID=A0ABP0QPF3_9DINO
MIEYEDGLQILCRLRGSVFPLAFLLTLPSVILTGAWCLLINDVTETSEVLETIVQDDFNKSQVWSALTASLSLLIAFRTRQALQRFWEGTTLMHQMRGEWFDSVSCLISFSRAARDTKPVEVQQFRDGRLLQKRLWALRHALEAADAEQRRQAIEKRLSPQLRQELLWLMEKVPSSREPRGVPKMRSQDPSRVRASLWTVRTSKGRYHAARLTFSGVVIATRATASKAEALRLRRRVEDLAQRAVRSGCPMDGPLEGFRTAVNCAADLDLGLNFRLVLDLRRYVGRKIQSPVLGSIEDVLRLRERLMEAQKGEKAWPALRREWVAWMTCPRRRRWKSCSRSHREAEELIEKAEAEWNVTKAKKLRDARQALRLARAARDAEGALLAEQRVKPLKRLGRMGLTIGWVMRSFQHDQPSPGVLSTALGNTLVRLASVMHGSALDEICGEGAAGQVCMDITGLDIDTLRFLRDCYDVYGFNKVEALQHMIQNLVTYNQQIGVLTIPPPILSRVYQTLSRGFVNLLNAKKIADTRFPFPWAQIITMLIVSYCISTPLVVSAIIKQYAWAMLVTFIPVFSIIALNIVCAQLEMPFGSDANDLPLQHFQEEMNRGLLLLIHEMTDHIVLTRDNAVKDHNSLMRCVSRELRGSVVAVRSTMTGAAYLEVEADEDVGDDTAAVPRESRVLKVKEVDPKEKLKEEKALSTLDAQSTRRNADLLNHQLTEIAQNTHALEANTKALRSLASLFDSVDVSSEAQATPDNGRQLLRDLRNLLTRVQVDDPGPVVNAQSAFCARCACETSPG